MKHNKKMAELVLWIILAVLSIVLIATGFNHPEKFLNKKGANCIVYNIYCQSDEL